MKKLVYWLLFLTVVAAAVAGGMLYWELRITQTAQAQALAEVEPEPEPEPEPEKVELITQASLERIIYISDLSTFQAVYNGIAQVMDTQNPDQVSYYVSYESMVKAGIELNDVDIQVDNQAQTVSVTLPDVQLTSVNVDIASLDYIFVDKTADTNGVSIQAYKACQADVETECQQETLIFELAQQNALNAIKALVLPFVSELEPDYTLVIQ